MNTKQHEPDREGFSQALAEWFAEHGRSYPWRQTSDPWAILVSEVMLQQTTIPTVLARYSDWLSKYPTPAALAAATEEEALRSWEGLGYYRRVRALRATALAIVHEHGGCFPTQEEEIRRLPGIGDYTVGALQSFAWNRPAPLVDANVSRVFARIYNDSTPIDSTAGRKKHWEWAAQLVHPTRARAYNSALMELGQTICTPKRPNCLLCPVRQWCRAEAPEKLPAKLAKKELQSMEHWDIWHLTERGLLLEKQQPQGRHAGMYRLPRRSRQEAEQYPLICHQKYSVTRYKVTRHLHRAPADAELPLNPGEEYISPAALTDMPLASPDRKLVLKLM